MFILFLTLVMFFLFHFVFIFHHSLLYFSKGETVHKSMKLQQYLGQSLEGNFTLHFGQAPDLTLIINCTY